jgi:hypothetical protein
MSSESSTSTYIMNRKTTAVKQLSTNILRALKTGTLQLVKTTVKRSDPTSLFRAYERQFSRPILYSAVHIWHYASNALSRRTMEAILHKLLTAGAEIDEACTNEL